MNKELLRKDELSLYNYVKLRNLVYDIFKLFRYIKRNDDKVALPKITMDYRVRYEQFVPVKSSCIENYVLNKLMAQSRQETERRILLSKITIALRTLNDLELKVFDLTFYKNVNEVEISKQVMYCVEKVRDIKKSACIKFISALGLDYMCFNQDVN